MSFLLPATVTQETASHLEKKSLQDMEYLGVIDCFRLRDFDSSVLAVLLAWRKRLQENNQSLVVEHAPEKLKVLAKVYGVSTLLGLL